MIVTTVQFSSHAQPPSSPLLKGALEPLKSVLAVGLGNKAVDTVDLKTDQIEPPKVYSRYFRVTDFQKAANLNWSQLYGMMREVHEAEGHQQKFGPFELFDGTEENNLGSVKNAAWFRRQVPSSWAVFGESLVMVLKLRLATVRQRILGQFFQQQQFLNNLKAEVSCVHEQAVSSPDQPLTDRLKHVTAALKRRIHQFLSGEPQELTQPDPPSHPGQ